MKTSLLPLVAVLSLGAVCRLSAQAPIPEPDSPANGQPVLLNPSAPLLSLEEQVKSGDFDQRGAFATAFDAANQSIDLQVAALRAQGLNFADEAEANLADARDRARQAFRDLSLTTSETWNSARENAVLALRRIRGAMGDMQRYATRSTF
jgi:hypothetical protein